jgi:mRNA interferase MazF
LRRADSPARGIGAIGAAPATSAPTTCPIARAGQPGRHRPAVVVSVGEILTGIDDDLIVVVPVSSSPAHNPLRPHISRTEAQTPKASPAAAASAPSLAPALPERLGTPAPDTMRQIERALALILGIHIA